jgi:formylglycine-generating enzyme required for sulfatase activity
MGSNPSWFRGKDAAAPVEQVSWNECQEFVRKLCEVEGVALGTYRLLTEAEWEYACRAGTGDASAGDLDAMAWYARNSRKATHPVGGKQPNAWGLHDMHGNVWEWCEDRKGGGKPSQAPASGGAGPEALSRRGPGGSPGDASRRGGGWGSLANGCRSAGRGWHAVDVRGHDVGLRLGRTVP